MSYELEDVSGIGKTTAEKMRAAGIDSIEKLIGLKPEDFVEHAKEYIIQTGALDIFTQSFIKNIFSEYKEDIPRVLETGLGIHTILGGDYYREDLRLKKLQFQKIIFGQFCLYCLHF